MSTNIRTGNNLNVPASGGIHNALSTIHSQFAPSFVFLSLQIPPPARQLARCFAFMHLQTPRRATPLYSHLYKMPGCHPPTLDLPSVLSPSIELRLFAATHPRNAPVTPFPATHPKIRGVGHIMVNQQQGGSPISQIDPINI